MHRIIRTKAYEAKHGPHFDEEHARKALLIRSSSVDVAED